MLLTSEFAHELGQMILKPIYSFLYGRVEENLNDLFKYLNDQFHETTTQIGLGPKLWNHGSAYATVQNIAESVCIPVAAVFVTVIFCWELIHLVQEKNAMQDVKPEKLLLVLMKFALCLFVCAYSFKIVTGIFDIGIWAARHARLEVSASISVTPTMADVGIVETPDPYTFEDTAKLGGYWIILNLVTVGVWVCGILVYIRTMMWFVECLLYASAAPIPYSTWINKEWSQMGMNYTRKMLALAFEGFFILALFGLYGGIIGGLQMQADFKESMVMILGCGFGIATMMFKVGNISASIFNAH